MGSRIGSLIVLIALAAIVLVAVLLVTRFAGDSDAEQPVILVSLINDQPVLLGQPLEVEVSVRSGEPITIFTLIVDGVIVTQATPIADYDQGRYTAVLFWTPEALGFAALRIVATDTAGAQPETSIRVDVTDDAQRVDQARQQARQQAGAAQPQATAQAQPAGANGGGSEQAAAAPRAAPPTNGAARILSPESGARYDLSSGESFDVELETSGTGPLSSVLFYVTPVLADGSFGRSQLAYSATPDVDAAGGVYREVVRGVQAWFTEAGPYDLQLVALTVDQERFEDLIRIVVSGEPAADQADNEPQAESADEPQAAQQSIDSSAADLAILTVRQDAEGISVTIINSGGGRAERVEIALSLIRTRDASLLASAGALLTLDPEQRANVPLQVRVAEPTDALLALESERDADASNNTFQLQLSPADSPDSSGPEGEPAAEDGETAPDGGQQASEPADPADDPSDEPADRLADLAFLEARFTDDGYALLTVVNAGEAASDEFVIHILAENGQILETIARGAAAAPLPPRGSEILAGSAVHSGTVVIVLDPNNSTPESNETNNLIRVEISP